VTASQIFVKRDSLPLRLIEVGNFHVVLVSMPPSETRSLRFISCPQINDSNSYAAAAMQFSESGAFACYARLYSRRAFM
jgi:hypothetical protein